MFLKAFTCFVITGFLLIPLSSAIAGGHTGQFGIGLSVNNESPAFAVHYWTSDHFTLNPEFAYQHTHIRDGGSANNFIPGLWIYYHFRSGSEFRPFAGAGFDINLLHTSGENYIDVMAGPAFGGEYFFSDHFSILGEYRLEVTHTDDEFSPDWLSTDTFYFQTRQILSVHFYF
jgi:hypothetical protein